MPKKIIIADDHPLILKGLNNILIENGFEVVGQGKNGQEAFELIKLNNPEVAILDIQMPKLSGLDVAKKCLEEQIDLNIVIITFEKSKRLYKEAISTQNIKGYILKEFALAEITECIEAVSNGETYFSKELLNYLEKTEAPAGLKLLTETETKVLKRMAENKTGVKIAEEMFVSPRTIEKHKSNIIKKLNLRGKQNSLVIWAKENQKHII